MGVRESLPRSGIRWFDETSEQTVEITRRRLDDLSLPYFISESEDLLALPVILQ